MVGCPKVKVWIAVLGVCVSLLGGARAYAGARTSSEEVQVSTGEVGRTGGRIVVALRAEPKTLNPVTAVDQPSREVIGRMIADLVHINRATQLTGSALAKSWKVSPDGRRYTLQLRRGLRFSDGQPFDADDVVFSFQVYLDEKINSPQRDLLMVGGKPIVVRKLSPYTVEFEMVQPYAAAERLFDSVAILPRHVLEADYHAGKLAQDWGLNSPVASVVGLGPFRLKEYVPGQRLVLERNPYYWKVDRKNARLPYLDEIVFLFVSSEDAQALRFKAGDTDIISRLSPDNFAALERDQAASGFRLDDLGPGLEFNFLFFNLNSVLPKNSGDLAKKQKWFQEVAFRQAVSAAIDREGINKLVYHGRGSVLATQVTPAYRSWIDTSLPLPVRSLERSRELLKRAGFTWASDGHLVDASGTPVEFSIATSASNAQRAQMATIIQDDLKDLGIKVTVVPLDFRSLLDRVFQSHDYEAVVLALGGGDVDPNPQMNVWLSNGSSHLWDLGEAKPATPWEAEIDRLMNQQLSTLDPKLRKKLYDRVQQIVAEQLPLICLVSPHILVGAKTSIGNFQPAILDHYTLWNADELYLRAPGR
ncbi:MAG TPA: ABC transporter substrate-binding protein [Terriglobales bacterium]|jgi:peptide/nickel transport system substrate-binding protein|nr:ABC transporter substrate-binding protein [Terriglobales bacterium]